MHKSLCYREALKALDWGTETVYTIGHKAPDTDTVTAAIAYADLMQKLGYPVEARIAGKANNETKYAAALFDFQIPSILEDASEQKLILVDHSEICQAVSGAKNARILQIIDHHGLGDVMESKRIFAKIFPSDRPVQLFSPASKNSTLKFQRASHGCCSPAFFPTPRI